MKVCIFCGNQPQHKTKEHIIPKWLIEITGDPGRTTLLGKYKGLLRKFPWKNFTFPACDSCNNEFSTLESAVKSVIEKITNLQSVDEAEINTLLDWFDKVRIGLWLGYLMLNNLSSFEPNFYIKQRLATSDRMLSIQFINDSEKGIIYTGTEFPAFTTSPSCFTLIINNVAFFNASKEFLFSRRLGLPYPDKTSFMADDKRLLIDKMIKGTERIMLPLIRKPLFSKSIKIYQAISNPLEDPLDEELLTDYFKDIIADKRSLVYLENDMLNTSGFLENEVEFSNVVSYGRHFLLNKLAIQTLDFQNYTLENLLPSLELLDKTEQKERKKFYRELVEYNKSYLGRLRKKAM